MVRRLILAAIVAFAFIMGGTVFAPVQAGTYTYTPQFLSKTVYIGILGEFDEEMYDYVVQETKHVTFKDTIILTINSNGGYVHVLQNIVMALKATGAKVIAVVPDHAFSAAASLLCYVDEVRVDPKAWIMYHTIRSGDNIEVPIIRTDHLSKDMIAALDYIDATFELCKKKGILTDRDIQKIHEGKDVFIPGVVVRTRLGG